MNLKIIVAIFFFQNLIIGQLNPEKLSLEDALIIGLENNTTIRKANKELLKAYKEKWRTISIGLPQIKSTISYQNFIEMPISLVPAEFFGGNPGEFAEISFGTEQIANASIKLEQLIFDGTYIIGLQGIKIYTEVAENIKKKTTQQIKKEIISAYINSLLSKENVIIIKNNISKISKNLEEVKNLYENGFSEEENVEQLRLTLNSLNSNLKYAEKLELISSKMLNLILGIDINKKIELTDKLDLLTVKNINFDKDSKANNLDFNLDLKIAQNNVLKKALLHKLEKAKSLPSLSGFISGAYTGNSNEFTFTKKNQKWFGSSVFGLKIDIPVFSSFERVANSQKSKLNLEQAEIELEETKNKVILNLEKLKNEYSLSIDNYFTAKENLSLARKIEEKNQIKFYEGLSSSFELREAQLQLFSSQSNYLNSMIKVINKKSELDIIINSPKKN